MGKKKPFHLHLSNQLKHLPRKLANLHSDPPDAQVMEGAIFDSFCSLGLSDCNLNNDQRLEVPAQYNNTAVMVPPSDRFFVSPSTSGTILEEEEELMVQPSYHRFFVSPSTSGLITLDQRVKSSEVTSSSNSISSDHESVLASSSSVPELDDTSSSSSDHAPLINIPGDGIAVSTDSDDPYQDFKQSIQEMLHHYSKAHRFQALDWDWLEELLFCYLQLNNRSMHQFIIKAFADVVVAALWPPCRQLERSIDGEDDQVN